MNTADISLYGYFENITNPNKKTQKFRLVKYVGFYPPFNKLIGKDGYVSLYLMESRSVKVNAPSMYLQAKGSLNLTGLKDYFIEGKISGCAYGYPLSVATYGNKKIENPFYNYKNDGFLFLVKQDEQNKGNIVPVGFEILVLTGAKPLIATYCKQLVLGGFDNTLNDLRQQAKEVVANTLFDVGKQ